MILVTHSMEEAARYSNRLLVISGGRVILDGSPAEIYQNHKNELLAVSMDVPQLLNSVMNCVHAGWKSRRIP